MMPAIKAEYLAVCKGEKNTDEGVELSEQSLSQTGESGSSTEHPVALV